MDDTDGLLLMLAEEAGSGLSPGRLDRVCAMLATAVGASGVAVTLAGSGTARAVVGASNEAARQLERAQLTLGAGPCTNATTGGREVRAADVRAPAEQRWPGLADLLADVPVRAVRAFPLRVGPVRIGSLDVHSDVPHGLDGLSEDVLARAVAAMTVAALVLRPFEVDAGATERVPVDQAVGIVQATLGVTGESALTALRDRAFLDGRLLHDVAADVVAGRIAPDLD